MLKGYKILTSFCVICATLYGGAYGAASVRGGATSRAGSIRTLGAGTTASVKTTTSRTQPTTTAANANTESTESVGGMRMSHATGLGGSKLPGKISGTTTSTSGDNQNVAELRQAIEQLRNDYDALGEQYNNLLGDVSNVSDTAQVAHETATNNTNTLTVVRSDLSVAKSDIEDLKATGGFDEERVQEALDTTLAQRNYATRGELAVTDAVARGAVQFADLPQTLNALNIADKDYVASRTQGMVNDSLNITLENYYTKGQVNAAIDVAKMGMVDKNYVDNQIDGLAAKTYVDNRVASIQTGVSEGAVQGIINNSIDTRLENYYTKGDIDDAIVDAIGAAKNGMADRDYVDNQVRDMASTEYVDAKVAEIEGGVDAGTLYNILSDYKTGVEVQGIVNDSINNTVANYYTKGQVDNAINVAKNGMADRNYVDNQIDGLAPKNWVNTVVDTKVNALPLGLDRDAVKAVVEEYGYKDEVGVREIMNTSGYVKTSELPDLVKQWAPGAEIQYADGKLYFVDKDGNDRVVDIRGLDGQDGDQVELRQNDGWIQWRWTSGDDLNWRNLISMSDLKGADGKSVELSVRPYGQVKNALGYTKEGETNWQFLYGLDDIKGADGCSVRATQTPVAGGTLVKLLRDCAGQSGDGDVLTQFTVLNGADGTVTEEQIVDALKSNPEFVQLKTQVNDLSDGLNNTNSLLSELSDRVDNNTTGLSATNTLANNAWNKVKDLESSNKTAREYVDDRIGDLGFDLLTRRNYASVAAKLGAIDDTKTVAEYINAQISKINTSIQVERGDDGVTYICKTGNNCTTNPNPYTGDWTRISVDVSGYLTRAEADDAFAPIGIVGAVTTAQDAASQAQTQASQAWGKLSDLGGDTVKGYVDNTIDGKIGFLGVSLLTGKDYSVADKIGIPGTDTVKKYIDDKLATVNTKIQVAQYNGQTYICKKGDTCTTPAGPYYPEDWAQITVDVSGYLTENDADKLYAPIGMVTIANDAKTIANEAKTAATAAQTSATQAQNAASAAQSTANDAWSKLNGLNGTVKDYVDDKVGSAGSTINVQTVNGVTYICRTGTCLDTPPSAYWAPIEVNISDEYLTETEGNALYALKTQIGDLGGSFTNVGAKIGLNDSNNSSKTVRQYVDDKFDSISTTIQVQTSTVDGFTYICKTGSGCTGEPSQNPNQWAKVNVDLGNLGTNPQTGQAYNVAQKIGLTDTANLSKTVFGYIGDRIGETGNSATYPYAQRSVVEYAQDTYVPFTKLGNEIGSSQTVTNYIGQRIGDTGMVYDSYTGQSRQKTTVEFVNGKIGTLGAYDNVIAYGNANYAPKSAFDTLTTTVSGHTNLLSGFDANTTVKQYVDSKTPNIQIAPGENGTMWYCTRSTPCDTNYVGNSYYGWASFNISDSLNLTSYLKTSDAATTYLTIAKANTDYYTKTEANANFAAKIVQDAVNNTTTGLSATYDLANSANTTANNAWAKVSGLDTVSGLANKTVTGYVDHRLGDITGTVKDYVDNHTPTITVTEGSDGNSYICTGGSCTGTPPGGTGWTKLNVDLSSINAVLTGFGASGQPETVKGYVDTSIGNLGKINDSTNASSVAAKLGTDITGADKTVAQYIGDKIGSLGGYYNGSYDVYYNVATKIGAIDSRQTVKGYVDASIGSLGKTNGSTNASSVADKLGTAITGADKTVAKYIEDYVAAIAASGGVTVKTFNVYGENKTYICSDNCTTIPPCTYPDQCGWQELNIDVSSKAEQSDMTAVQNILAGFGTGTGNWATVKTYIGDMGSYKDSYSNDVNYTVATKIGLNTDDTKNKSVTQYIADKLGFTGPDADKTVVQYVAEHATGGSVQVQSVNGTTYICSENCDGVGTPPCAEGTYPSTCGWQKLEVNLNGYATEDYVKDKIGALGGDFANVGAKIDIGSGTVKSYVDAVDNRIGSLGYHVVAGERKQYTVSEKLGLPADYGDETVAKYIVDYVATNAASGGVTVRTVTNGGVSETYICSENCDSTPPCQVSDTPDTCGWQKLEVDLSQYLKSSDAASTYLPRTNLKLVRDGADIHLKRVVGDDVTDYGIVAGVQDLMCRSYRTETVEPGVDGCPASGSACYKMICNTNGND